MRGATSTLGALPCWAAVMRSVIGDSFLKAANATRPSLSFRASLSESPYKGVLSGHCPGPCDNPERTAQPRLLVREGAAHAGRPGPGACPIQRALAGNLEKRTAGPRACQCRGTPLEGGNGPIRASRQRTGRPSQRRLGGNNRPRRIVLGGAEAGGATTAQLRVRPRAGGSGCATQGDARGPSSALRTVLTATDPWEQSNAEPPLTPSPERVPRIAHAALGCAILVQG